MTVKRADQPITEAERKDIRSVQAGDVVVIQDKSLPTVWDEFRGLSRLEVNNQASRTRGNRRQDFLLLLSVGRVI